MNKAEKSFQFYLPIVALSILYFLTGKASLDLLSGDRIVNIGLFAAEGVSLAFALYFGKRVIPGIFIGQFFLAYSNGVNIFTTLEIATINSLEAYIAILLFSKFKLSAELRTFRDTVGLFLLIVFILQPFGAILSNLSLLFHGEILQEELIYSTYSWWFGNVMGQFVFTPFLLLLFLYSKKIDFIEYNFYAVGFSIFLYVFMILFKIENAFLLLSITLPIGLAIVHKKGLVYGSMLSVIVAIIASYSVYLNIGAFYIHSDIDNAINYNLFILAFVSTLSSAGILLDERKRYALALEETIKMEVEKNREQQLLMLRQSRLAQMGEMIGMIAHQWRQPLNNLALVNQLLISRYDNDILDDKSMSYFKDKSKQHIEFMSNTVDDFRNFFKTEDKKSSFDITQTIEKTLAMTGETYHKLGVEICFKTEINYFILGHPNALAQAIINILNNARDALIENNIKNKKIDISIVEHIDSLFIIIEDNGGGVPAEIIDKIFDPYFSTRKDKNGTGLGLYMSKMILKEQLNAELEVSNENMGARFEICIDKGNNATS